MKGADPATALAASIQRPVEGGRERDAVARVVVVGFGKRDEVRRPTITLQPESGAMPPSTS